MDTLPKRKKIRIENYDYATAGAYFITICTAGREEVLWEFVGVATCRPQTIPLSPIGRTVEQSVLQISDYYTSVTVDKFCVMPNHIHLILRIESNVNGRQVAAPTVSTVVGHMKRWVSMQLGQSIWQKSFYEHSIRNQQDYNEIWEYIDNNPLKYMQKRTP